MSWNRLKIAFVSFSSLLASLATQAAHAEVSADEIAVLRQSAQSGEPESLHALGVALQNDSDETNNLEGRDLLIQAAEAGRWGSAFYLGQTYLYGWKDWGRVDGEANGQEAVRWLRRAGEIAAGDPYARDVYSLLGQIYAGQYIRDLPHNLPQKDVVEAAKWFRLCAVSDDPYTGRYCRGQLGMLLIEQPGAEREGLEWLEKAAAFAEPWSMNRLGDVYSNGKIVPSDLPLALSWYKRSIEWTERYGIQNDLISDSRWKAEELKKRMVADQIVRGEELAREFKPKSAP